MSRSLLLGALLALLVIAPVQADVVFDCDECLHVVLQIDRSGSMDNDSKLDRAKAGAKELVNRLKEGDAVAVTTASGSGKLQLAMTTIETAADRDTICDVIDGLDTGSGNTNIGDALRHGLNELQANREDGCRELIVVIGDGDHNTDAVEDPETPADVTPDLIADGVKVTTFSLTDGLIDLPKLANDTGGCAFESVKWWQIYQLYVRTAMSALGKDVILDTAEEVDSGNLGVGESSSFDYEAEVPVGSTCATFCIAMNKELPGAGDPAFTVTCELTSPSGDVVETVDVSQDCCHDVFDPEAGTWTVSLIVTLDACGDTTCKASRKTKVFASSASCPLSAVDCDYSELGDVVAIDDDGIPHVYDEIQGALDDAQNGHLRQIFMFASETSTTAEVYYLTDVDIVACGDVTIRRLKIKGCEDVTVSGFDVAARGKSYASKIYGYSRSNTGVIIENCSFSGARYYGMIVDHRNEDVNLIGCDISDNGKYGIWFQGDGTATVSECNLDGNGRYAMRIQGVVILIEYSNITNSGSQGIYSFCTSDCLPEYVTLIQNVFEGNDGSVGHSKDENLGNISHIIDATDDQPGYEVPAP